MITFTSDEQFNEIIKTSPFVVIDFYATWCGPCKLLSPQLERLSQIYTNVKFIKVDVDEFEDIAQEHQVSAMPTILFYTKGVLLTDNVIGCDVNLIERIIKQHHTSH